MRICYLADAMSVHTRKWAGYFADRGHEVHLVSENMLEGDSLPNIEFHHLRKVQSVRIIPLLVLMVRIKRLINKVRPDILHAHYATTYGFWAALTMFHPFVLTVWGSDILITPDNSRLAKYKTKFLLRRADLITCDADHVLGRMIELGAERQKIRLVFFGVDTEVFTPSRRDHDFRKEMKLEQDSLIVISLRNLNPIYDVESLVRAVPLVLRNVPRARFIIAGKGEQENYLKDLAQSLGVAYNIRFVGSIPNVEMPRYLSSSDVYVSTSLSDAGIAASTAEAMACQMPVIITDVAENRKWVKDKEGGFIVPPKDPMILAERIVYLLENKSIRESFGIVNRKTIQDRNEYKKQMKEMERAYEELVEKA